MFLLINRVCGLLGSVAFTGILFGCSTQTSYVPAQTSTLPTETSSAPLLSSKRDACSFVRGQQYPYDWEGSDIGACVRQLPPQPITTMEPDQIGGLFEVPRTTYKDNLVRISSPVGMGVGEWNGQYINGTIATSQGEVEFFCAGAEVTGSSRGLCGLR